METDFFNSIGQKRTVIEAGGQVKVVRPTELRSMRRVENRGAFSTNSYPGHLRWAGAMDVTLDAIPVIGPVTRLPGLYLSTGYSGHGFGIAPGAGHLLVDPSPFAFERLGYP